MKRVTRSRWFCAPTRTVRIALERLEARDVPAIVGGLDLSFNADGTGIYDPGGNDFGTAVAIDSLGRIVVVGRDGGGSGGDDFEIIRLTPAGVLDGALNDELSFHRASVWRPCQGAKQ